MNREVPLTLVFFQTGAGRMPVQEWLRNLEKADRKEIGEDIKVVQRRWPLRTRVVKKLERDLWEIRSNLRGRRIARILFTCKEHEIVLLHGFIKKSQKIPSSELNLARERRKIWQSGVAIRE